MTMQETVDELTTLVERLTDLVIRLEARTDKLENALRPQPGGVCHSDECFPRPWIYVRDGDEREPHNHGEECSVDCDCALGVPVGDFPGGAYPMAGHVEPVTGGSTTFNHASMVAAINTEALGARFKNPDQAEAWVKANFQFEPRREFPNGPEL